MAPKLVKGIKEANEKRFENQQLIGKITIIIMF
jgi:hypothetical protein